MPSVGRDTLTCIWFCKCWFCVVLLLVIAVVFINWNSGVSQRCLQQRSNFMLLDTFVVLPGIETTFCTSRQWTQLLFSWHFSTFVFSFLSFLFSRSSIQDHQGKIIQPVFPSWFCHYRILPQHQFHHTWIKTVMTNTFIDSMNADKSVTFYFSFVNTLEITTE